MKHIKSEFKLATISWVVMMLGLLIGFNFSETLGKLIVFLSMPVLFYAIIKIQKKLFSLSKDKESD